MPRLKWGILASLLAMSISLSGCSKPVAVPPSAPVPAPPAVPPPLPGQLAPAASPAAPATAPSGAPTTASTSSPQLQQRLLALGAKLKKTSDDVTRNSMKMLGLAFHNFHDTHNGFPAVNGIGEPGMFDKLSWRVALLPYLDESELYQQFHHNEPWDSEHNKTLITRMPKVFGQSTEGKTRVHVLTGNGVPFQTDKRVKIQEILDGTSNTIMTFVGGPDTAEIWTKPGGREFDPKTPLSALGNVGETFFIGTMDGATFSLPKTVPADQFALLAQHQDGQGVDLSALTRGTSPEGGMLAGININAPAAPPGPANPKIDMTHIPADAFLAFVLHPRRAYHHPVVRQVREMFPAESQEALTEGLPWDIRQGFMQVGILREQLGIAVEHVDEVVAILDKSLPDALMANPFAPPPFGVIVRNSAPLDIDGIAANLTRDREGIEIVEHEGIALILGPKTAPRNVAPPLAPPTPTETKTPAKPAPDPCQVTPEEGGPASEDAGPRMAVAFVSEQLVLLGNDAVVRKMISTRTPVTSALTQQLETLGNPLAVLAVNSTSVEKSLRTATKGLPPGIGIFSPYVLGIHQINLSLDLDAKNFLDLKVKFKSPELAGGLFGLLEGQFKSFKEQYPMLREMAGDEPPTVQALEYADQVVAETVFNNTAETISLEIPQIKNLDKLPEALKPVVDNAREGAKRSQQLNTLKQIALAFHNYHDVMSHFPAANGSGSKDKPHPGLSWRVYLLPYIEGAPLYNRFKLDEPWDSPHNKALIPEMPKFFGTNTEGKTRIHVIVGEGTPLQNDAGIKLAEITDGLSNTILVVEAGEDTAEFWTKPGGLSFDPADPLKCLGSIKEFYAVLFDGSVRIIKNIDAETFSKAVRHSDGMPVELP